MLSLILASLLVATSAQSCGNSQGPCLAITSNSNTFYVCPEGMACLKNSTCCNYVDIQVSTSTVIPTTSSICADKLNPNTGISDCPKNANLCTNPIYVKLMKDQCPKTCGYC